MFSICCTGQCIFRMLCSRLTNQASWRRKQPALSVCITLRFKLHWLPPCVLLCGGGVELDGNRIFPLPFPSESSWFDRQATSWEIFKSFHPTALWNPSYINNLYCHSSFLYTISYTFKFHLTIVSFLREQRRNKSSSQIHFSISNAEITFWYVNYTLFNCIIMSLLGCL